MSNQRFDSAPAFKVDADPVVIQAGVGSSSNLLVLKASDGSTLSAISTTGAVTAPTATVGTNTTQVATTEFVQTAIANLVASAPATLNTLDELAAALGDDANFASTIASSLATKAPIDAPTFTGAVTLPSSTSIGLVSATELAYLDGVTSSIQAQIDTKAPSANPTLTGVPTAPTASAGTNTTQIATTAFATELVNAFLPAGMLTPYAGSTAPNGWLFCAGQTVSRTTYSRLFDAIGVTYNTGGEASSDFRLPDLRGRTIAGLDNMGGQPSASRLTSATITSGANALGRVGGAETHVLTEAELASHTHLQNSHNHTQNSHAHGNSLTGTTSFAATNHQHAGQADGGYLHAAIGATNSDANRIGYVAGGIYANPSTYSVSGSSLVINPTFNHNTPVYGYVGTPTSTGSVGISNAGETATNQAQTATNQTTGSGAAHNNVQPTMVLNYIIKV